jgi:hypothetical protein
MTTHPIPRDTLVVVADRLGRIVKEAQIGAAHGYSISTAIEGHEGSAPHFAERYAVQVAELGMNVCRQPRGQHFCGLLHVTQADLTVLGGGR